MTVFEVGIQGSLRSGLFVIATFLSVVVMLLNRQVAFSVRPMDFSLRFFFYAIAWIPSSKTLGNNYSVPHFDT
jgi:hypothetical protein